MAESTGVQTIEEHVQNPETKVSQIGEKDASQGKVVEQGNNASGGIPPFQAELSKAEELFSNGEKSGLVGSSLEEGIQQKTDLSINSDKPIRYNSREVQTRKGDKTIKDSAYWLNARLEGVPA